MKRTMYLCALLAVIGCKKQEEQGTTGNQTGSGSPTSGTYTSTNPSTGTPATPGTSGRSGSTSASGSTGSMGAGATTGSAGSAGSAGTTMSGSAAGSAGTMSGSAAGSAEHARVALAPKGDSKIAGTIELSDLGNGVAVRADLRNAPKSGTLTLAIVDGCAAGNSVIASMGRLDVDPDGTVSFATSVQDQSLAGTGSESLMGKSVAIRDAKGKDLACGAIRSDSGSPGKTSGGTSQGK
jgi:hypothetical protein